MGNSFNISVAPEIAALEAKVDTIDTVVDSIRSTDVFNLASAIANNSVDIGVIHNTDLPDLSAIVNNIGIAVVAIDTVVDAVKAKTDLLPAIVRGSPVNAWYFSTDNDLHTIVDISGSGIIYHIACYFAVIANTAAFDITIDGVAWNHVTVASIANFDMAYLTPRSATSALPHVKGILNLPFNLNYEFKSSVLITGQRTVGAGQIDFNCLYALN